MAGLRTRCNPLFSSKDEFAKASTKENSTSPLSLVQAPTQVFALTSASAFASSLLERYMDKDLQRATKLALKLFIKD